jgi:hypothetical protein
MGAVLNKYSQPLIAFFHFPTTAEDMIDKGMAMLK